MVIKVGVEEIKYDNTRTFVREFSFIQVERLEEVSYKSETGDS